MAEDKVYEPELIQDNPFPGQVDQVSYDETNPTSGGVSEPTKVQSQMAPIKQVATELLSNVLNTKSKKILKEVQFTESGAIQIGKYVPGVSGDIRISSTGLVARNKDGNLTIVLDGDDGDATFAGQIQSGSLVTGSLVIDDGGSITLQDADDTTVIDSKGLVSTSAFNSFEAVSTSINQSITTAEPSWTDITNSSLEFSLERETLVIFMAEIIFWVERDTGSGDYQGDALIRFNLNDDYVGRRVWHRAKYNSATFDNNGTDNARTMSMHHVQLVPKGTNTLKLQGTINVVSGDPKINIYSINVNCVVLGK
jgi:hypothetical protein